jgi:anti-sigma factor RsiW
MGHEQLHELSAAYALDALDPADREDFEQHLAGCDACRAQVAALTETAAALALAAGPAEPPARLRGQLLQRVRDEGGVVVPLRRRGVERGLAAGLAIAAAAAVILGIWAGSLHGRLGDERAARLSAQQAAAVLGDSTATSVPLHGTDGRLVVGSDHRGVLVVGGLANAARGKTFEAWVISNGMPKPAGLFTQGGVVPLTRRVTPGSIVALTVEPSGGSSRPTSSPFALTARV